MKKSCISMVLSLLLVVQPTLPIFEGAKQKISDKFASVKDAIFRGKTLLRNNEECLMLGTGKGCDAGTRTGLQILADLLSGNLEKIKAAKKRAQEFMKDNWNCMIAGLKIQEIDKLPAGCSEGKAIGLSQIFLLTAIASLFLVSTGLAVAGVTLAFEGHFRDEVQAIWEKAHRWDRGGVYRLFYTDIPVLIDKYRDLGKSFNSIRYKGQTLIGLALSLSPKQGLSDKDKLALIEWLREKGVVPTRDEQDGIGRLHILERPVSPLYERPLAEGAE